MASSRTKVMAAMTTTTRTYVDTFPIESEADFAEAWAAAADCCAALAAVWTLPTAVCNELIPVWI